MLIMALMSIPGIIMPGIMPGIAAIMPMPQNSLSKNHDARLKGPADS